MNPYSNYNQSNDATNAQFEQLHKRIEERDQIIEQLMAKLGMTNGHAAEASQPQTSNGTSMRDPKPKKDKTKAISTPAKASKAAKPSPARKTPAKKSPKFKPQQSTPVNQRQRSATPASSTKKHPLQMCLKNQPAGFERTREAFYMHIKLLWGMLSQRSVPTAPDPTLLREFNERFSNPDQLEAAIYSTGTHNLVAEEEIQVLRNAKEGTLKLGKYMANISQFFLEYMWATMAKLGLRFWAPDLDAQIDSLYNEACRMSAIVTFRQAVANGVYQFMSVNPTYIKDVALLQSTYNHYVHFYLAGIYSKEKKVEGKHLQDEEKKVIQKSRERLRDARYKFAVAHKLPKRYQAILKQIQAHSDDEYFPKKDVYVVKNLPYRSQKASLFIRRLDEEIKTERAESGRRNQQRKRVRVKNAPDSIFLKAPIGLPIDFYDPDWFNSKLPAQKKRIADNKSVAFLPDPTRSLRPESAKEEFVGTRTFNERNWSKAIKPYDLSYEIKRESESEDSSEEDDEDDSDYGESIDLELESSGSDEDGSDDEYEQEDNGDGRGAGEGGHEVDYIDRPRVDEPDEVMDDGDFNEAEYGRSNFYGGMEDNEWAQYQ